MLGGSEDPPDVLLGVSEDPPYFDSGVAGGF
jgi:hypothetical protein